MEASGFYFTIGLIEQTTNMAWVSRSLTEKRRTEKFFKARDSSLPQPGDASRKVKPNFSPVNGK